MAAVTRFGLEGYGVSPAGDFSGKASPTVQAGFGSMLGFWMGGSGSVAIADQAGFSGMLGYWVGGGGGGTGTPDTGTSTDWLVRARRRGCR